MGRLLRRFVSYLIRVNQSDGASNSCTVDIPVVVAAPRIDFCAGVTASGGVEMISVSGVTAPWRSVQYRPSYSSSFTTLCTENCGNPLTITGVPAGSYVIKVEQSDGANNFCTVDIAVTVTAPQVNFCANVSAAGGVQTITVNGVNAPWTSIKYRYANGSIFTPLCAENCFDPITFTGIQPGSYVLKIEQSDGTNNYCTVDIPVTVAAPRIDYCAGVAASGGVNKIAISGVTAPWRSIQYRFANGSVYTPICDENCGNPLSLTGVPAGQYVVKVNQSDGGGANSCTVEIPVTVASPAVASYCSDVAITPGANKITVMGVNAPWHRVLISGPSTNNKLWTACNENCAGATGNGIVIKNLLPGHYKVVTEESGSAHGACQTETTVYVSGGLLTDQIAGSRSAAPASPMLPIASEKDIELAEASPNTTTQTIDFNTLIPHTEKPTLDLTAISLFPNPAQNELHINLQNFAGKNATLLIINQVGAVVENLTIKELTAAPVKVDLSKQPNGLYFMRASIDGSETVTKKFMITK